MAVLAGNTSTRFTWVHGRRVLRHVIVPTSSLRHPHSTTRPLDHWATCSCALASVVPAVTPRLVRDLTTAAGTAPFIVTPRARTGLRFRYNRAQLGADRVCAAVGARMLYEGNIIVVDFGTAVTLNVVSRDGTFLGGTIMPGPALLLESLARGTARLPLIRHSSFTIRHSPPALGRDTRSAIRVGVLAQLSGGISASVEAIRASTHRRYRVVATGGAACLARHIPAIEQVEPHLAALGLARLYRVNRNDSRD